jgi:hypothetical protein
VEGRIPGSLDITNATKRGQLAANFGNSSAEYAWRKSM